MIYIYVYIYIYTFIYIYIHIYIYCRYFQDYLQTQNMFLFWQAEYSHFATQRWRYLHITLHRIFSCCVSCNGLSLGIKYLWNTLEKKTHIHIPSPKPLEIEVAKDQTNRMGWEDRTAAGLTLRSWPGRPDGLYKWDCFIDFIRSDCNAKDPLTLVCRSWFPGVWRGGSPKKRITPRPQRGLEREKTEL